MLVISGVVLLVLMLILVLVQSILSRKGTTNTSTLSPTGIATRTGGRTTSSSYQPATGNPLSPRAEQEATILREKIPVTTKDFDISYSPELDKFVITRKTPGADLAIDEWAKKNGYKDIIHNEDILVIGDKTIPQIREELKQTHPELFILPTAASSSQSSSLSPEEMNLKAQSKLVSDFLDIFIRPPPPATGTPYPTAITVQVPSPTVEPTAEPEPTAGSSSSGGTSSSSAPSSIAALFPNPLPKASDKAQSFKSSVSTCLGNKSVYEQAAAKTGMQWQVLGAIHYLEGGCNPTHSLVSGRLIGENEPDIVRGGGCSSGTSGPGIPKPLAGGGCGFDTLLDSAIYAGNHLKGKIGHVPANFEDIVTAFSRYNGGGNSNCGKTPYTHCPPDFRGEDDPYPLSYFDTKHDPMYLVYCADLTKCDPPRAFQRPGAVTVIRLIESL